MKLIRLCNVFIALFHKHAAISAQGLSFLSLVATRFATNFFMVTKILDMKEALKQTMTNLEWDTYVRTLSDMQNKLVRAQAQEGRKLILERMLVLVLFSIHTTFIIWNCVMTNMQLWDL
jgi:hypothetical protein